MGARACAFAAALETATQARSAQLGLEIATGARSKPQRRSKWLLGSAAWRLKWLLELASLPQGREMAARACPGATTAFEVAARRSNRCAKWPLRSCNGSPTRCSSMSRSRRGVKKLCRNVCSENVSVGLLSESSCSEPLQHCNCSTFQCFIFVASRIFNISTCQHSKART